MNGVRRRQNTAIFVDIGLRGSGRFSAPAECQLRRSLFVLAHIAASVHLGCAASVALTKAAATTIINSTSVSDPQYDYEITTHVYYHKALGCRPCRRLPSKNLSPSLGARSASTIRPVMKQPGAVSASFVSDAIASAKCYESYAARQELSCYHIWVCFRRKRGAHARDCLSRRDWTRSYGCSARPHGCSARRCGTGWSVTPRR